METLHQMLRMMSGRRPFMQLQATTSSRDGQSRCVGESKHSLSLSACLFSLQVCEPSSLILVS